ncbi:MAG: copper resistance protein CopC, partial [Nostocoides sp.]
MNFSVGRRSPVRAVLVVLPLVIRLLLVIGLPLGLAASASAHAQLVSISPAEGSTVTTPPSEVIVTFNDTLAPGLSVVAVKSASG